MWGKPSVWKQPALHSLNMKHEACTTEIASPLATAFHRQETAFQSADEVEMKFHTAYLRGRQIHQCLEMYFFFTFMNVHFFKLWLDLFFCEFKAIPHL